MDHAGRRHTEHNALREVGVLRDNDQIVLLRVRPKLGIAEPRSQIQGVRDRPAGLQGWNARHVFVEEETRHATGSNEYWFPISRAA